MSHVDLYKLDHGAGRPGISSYRGLLQTFLDVGLVPRTHAEDFAADAPPGKCILLRHDVDNNLNNAVKMARIEHEMGIRSVYYLLHPGDYGKSENYYGSIVDGRVVHSARLQEAVCEMAELGHEIGLHNDFVQLSVKTGTDLAELISDELSYFGGLGIKVMGTASHGSRFVVEHGFINYEIFTERLKPGATPRTVTFADGGTRELFALSYKDLGLTYEAYAIRRDSYISDSGNRFVVNREALEAVDLAKLRDSIADKERVVALLHPNWWFETGTVPEKKRGNRRHPLDTTGITSEPVFRRNDGKPVRIGVRGDCCCRRMVGMNPAMFPDGTTMVVNEKCPNAAFVDTLHGKTVTDAELRGLSDVEAMPKSLKTYYLHQNERTVLELRDLDLLVMDPYSDMNFGQWTLKESGNSVWIHPKYVQTNGALAASLVKNGRVSLDAAVTHAVAVIDHVRSHNPGLPVLFLTQPVEYYPKLDSRRQFYQMGARVAAERSGVYHSDALDMSELEPDDLGSCGPGKTLHFTGETYRRMVKQAWQRGLARHFDGTDAARQEVAAAGTTPPRPGPGGGRPSLSSARRVVRRLRRKARRAGRKARRLRDRALAPGALGRLSHRVRSRIAPSAGQPAPTATAAPQPSAPMKIASPPLPEEPQEELPKVTLSFQRGSNTCVPDCDRRVERAHSSYLEYFNLPEDEAPRAKRFIPMLISTDELADFEAWEATIKTFGKGARLRQKRKAERMGYVFHEFAWQQFIPDIHDINHSKEVRSGGAMRGSYLRSVEEMGGAPKLHIAPAPPACGNHWDLRFGVFLPEPGHVQGEVTVDERLVAYIALNRTGDVVLYSMIMGHGEHLPNGVLVLLHHELIKWVGSQREGLTNGVRYVMYGGKGNGGASLLQWKRQAGFRPHVVDAVDAD